MGFANWLRGAISGMAMISVGYWVLQNYGNIDSWKGHAILFASAGFSQLIYAALGKVPFVVMPWFAVNVAGGIFFLG